MKTIEAPPVIDPAETDEDKTCNIYSEKIILVPVFAVSRSHLTHVALQQGFWCMMGNLYYKRYIDKKHKLPFSGREAEPIMPFFDLLLIIRRLCQENCGEHSFPENQFYKRDWLLWFLSIVREVKVVWIWEIFNPPSGKNTQKANTLRTLKKNISKLRKGKNPCNKDMMPHLWRLIESSIKLREKSLEGEELWKSLIKAYDRWQVELSSSKWKWVCASEDESKLLMQSGQGRGKLSLPLLEDEFFS